MVSFAEYEVHYPVIGFGRKLNEDLKANPYRWYTPRCWHGMRCKDWFQMLRRNRFSVSPMRWGLACTVSAVSLFNSVCYRIQRSRYGREIELTEIVTPPIFVIGHWRSGTTLLHEMLSQDTRFTYPNTYACFSPNHFVLSQKFMTPWLRYLLPRERPMDRMRVGWDRPQEDEFALVNMGFLSPYEALAFPNQVQPGMGFLDVDQWDAKERQRWKDSLVWFLKSVTYCDPKPLILKSPPHTSRIKTLLETFPHARFAHMVRDPYVVFSSTMRLWKSLSLVQGLQVPRYEDLEESVFSCFENMYTSLSRQKKLVDPSRYAEVRFEDLVSDPEGQLRKFYDRLDLGDFESYLPRLRRYLSETADYQTNHYQLSAETREKISHRWADYIEEYGYTDTAS